MVYSLSTRLLSYHTSRVRLALSATTLSANTLLPCSVLLPRSGNYLRIPTVSVTQSTGLLGYFIAFSLLLNTSQVPHANTLYPIPSRPTSPTPSYLTITPDNPFIITFLLHLHIPNKCQNKSVKQGVHPFTGIKFLLKFPFSFGYVLEGCFHYL